MTFFKTVLTALVVSLIVSYGVITFHTPQSVDGVATPSKETSYQRVMRTGVLRCGYVDYAPHTFPDLKTGEMKGIMAEIIEEAARLLKIEVEWAEQVGWGNTVTTLESGRIDAICTSFWRAPAEGKHINYTMPLFLSPMGTYVRADDSRFDDGNLSKLNSPEFKATSADGSLSGIIANEDFPKMQVLMMPNMTDETTNLLNVQTGKADVAFVETYIGEKYRQANPGKLKNLSVDPPIRLFRNTIALPQNDRPLEIMLNSALIQLLDSGFIDRTIAKYEEVAGGIYRVDRPYRID